MMTQHAPKSTALGAALVGACLILVSAHARARADAIEPPAPHPTQVLLSPGPSTYELRFSEEGESLVVAKVHYGDGTVVSHAVGALLLGTDLPVELVFLDTFQPSPQALRVPAAHLDVTPLARPRLQGLARTLDFSPQSPFWVRVRQMPGFAEPAVLLKSREVWESMAPTCLKDEWLAMARIHPASAKASTVPMEFGALKHSVHALTAKATHSVGSERTAAPLSPTRSYFSFGEFVCVSFTEGVEKAASVR